MFFCSPTLGSPSPHSSCNAFTSTHQGAEGCLQQRSLTRQDAVPLSSQGNHYGEPNLSFVLTLHRGNILFSCWLAGRGLHCHWLLSGLLYGSISSVGSSIGATSLGGTLTGASSSLGAASLAGANQVFLGIVALVSPSRGLSQGAAPSRMASLEKAMYGSIAHLNSGTHSAKRCSWPGIDRLDFSAQNCRACA